MKETMPSWMRLTIWLSLVVGGIVVFWIRDCNRAPSSAPPALDAGRSWAADCARACAYAGRAMKKAIRSAGPDECTCEPLLTPTTPDGGP